MTVLSLSPDLADAELHVRVRDALERNWGCRVDWDPTYRSLYHVDFLVNRIVGVHAMVNLGVHVTTTTDDLESQDIFVEMARRGVVQKAIYLELPASGVETGALVVAFGAFLTFLFDHRYREFKSVGLRLFPDHSFHFFSLEENVRRLRRDVHENAHPYGERFSGEVVAYFGHKGFGFIESGAGEKFFFHVADVDDEDLRILLPSFVQGESIPVHFFFGGSEGKKYPKAINVSLARPENDAEG